MPKVILDVTENWHRRYLVDVPDVPDDIGKFTADDERKVIDAYHKHVSTWCGPVEELGPSDFISDGPDDEFILEGIWRDTTASDASRS